MGVARIALERVERSRKQLALGFSADDLRFTTSLWWSDLSFPELEARYGAEVLDRICFHVAAFELNKLVSLAPERVDFGPWSRFVTPAFERLWTRIADKVWAQWRYEHDRPEYRGPRFVRPGSSEAIAPPIALAGPESGAPEVLAFSGGGKDSLVALRLLEQAEVPYAAYAYSHAVYGPAERQHALLGGLLDHCRPARRHRHWVYDDAIDSPLMSLQPELGVRSWTAAETPSSIFGALPLVLSKGYTQLVLAHERSANTGNLVWAKTGEEVNHQWGKSLEAELLINAYLGELISGVRYFSILQPVHDLLIFRLLANHLDAVPAAHSCNLEKPWCRRCPKCAYVWLNYQAHLPRQLVDAIFGENLLDKEENQLWYRQMLGLGEHTPFECIGMIDEVRIAFALCRRRGLSGRAMTMFENEVPPFDPAVLGAKYRQVHPSPTIPAWLWDKIEPELARASRSAAELL
jgi:hypothetical protein